MNTKVKAIAAMAVIIAAASCSRSQTAVYLDESQSLEARVEDALSRMTLEEKVGILMHSLNSLRPAFHALVFRNFGPQTVRTESVLK